MIVIPILHWENAMMRCMFTITRLRNGKRCLYLPSMLIAPRPQKYLLYADDDLDDQEMLITMMSRIHPEVAVFCCVNGQETFQFLEGIRTGEQFPCCIILDMNMPLWDGLQTLQELKKHDIFSAIPVAIFTTSANETERQRSLELGAEAFLTKPVLAHEIQDAAQHLSLFARREPLFKKEIVPLVGE